MKLTGLVCLLALAWTAHGAGSTADEKILERNLHAPVDGQGKVSGRCVCIFDFDETLRVWKDGNGDTPAADSAGIIKKCKDYGYEVAIASANCWKHKMEKVLPQINGEVFSPHFFTTQAFQHCDHWKINELQKILHHFGTKPECTMFFDDQPHNVHKHAESVGVNWSLVNGHSGVTWSDFWGVRPQMLNRCNCT